MQTKWKSNILHPFFDGCIVFRSHFMYKDGKWARKLIAAQRPDGSWGWFHTLSTPRSSGALAVLGYTYEDAPMRLAIDHLRACLAGQEELQNNREVTLDWDIFTELMLSTWIRLFTADDENANVTATRWARIATAAFSSGAFRIEDYDAAYDAVFSGWPRCKKRVSFGTFYLAALLPGLLDPVTERRVMDYFLTLPNGIYYIATGRLCEPPAEFCSLECSRYLAAWELLARYASGPEALRFAADWLEEHRDGDGCWDMGMQAKDGIYFPLSDSWRTADLRRADCTYRIEKLLQRLRA